MSDLVENPEDRFSHDVAHLFQGDCRTYSYVAGISGLRAIADINWNSIMTLAKIIPRICHNINR